MKDSFIDYKEKLQKIAMEIEKLKTKYPQLKNFDSKKNINLEDMSISYYYKTKKPVKGSGWQSAVPKPTAKGIWIYFDFHSPDSKEQIHTQPLTPCYSIGEKKVTIFILEGQKTLSVAADLMTILKNNGIADCKE